jgi:hypothetical protein
VRGAHDTPEAQRVMPTRGCVGALPLRGRGEGGNWTHERKSENLINEHALRKIANLFWCMANETQHEHDAVVACF